MIDKVLYSSAQFTPHRNFWTQQIQLLEAPFSWQGEGEKQLEKDQLTIAIPIPAQHVQVISNLVKGNDVGIFVVVLSALETLLYKYTGSTQPIVHTLPFTQSPESGEAERTMPVINKLDPGDSIKGLLVQLQQTVTKSFEFQQLPMEALSAFSGSPEKSSNVLFTYDAIHARPTQTDGFDIHIRLLKQQEGLVLAFQYHAAIFSEAYLQQAMQHLSAIWAHYKKVDTPIRQVALLSKEEEAQLLKAYDRSAVAYNTGLLIHQQFETRAATYPERVALCFQKERMTYERLNKKANQVAHTLREKGVGPDQIVGLLVDRSLSMVIGIFGILKAGGAYLPIDPSYPQKRINHTLQDSGCRLLLTQTKYIHQAEFDGIVLDLDDPETYHANTANPDKINSPTDLAYIIYTSGSTGQPKGAMINHQNVIRLLFNKEPLFDFNESDVWTLFHNYCFDFSVWEMYGALLYGGRLVIVPSPALRDPGNYLALLAAEQVTVLNSTPGAFYTLADHSAREDLQLRYVVFGGEALQPLKLKEWHERYPKCRLINMYGITETTVHVTFQAITQKEIDQNSISVGYPIPTLRCLVLNKDGQLQPPDVPGELCVGGAGVARGYLNREALTQAKFVPDPYYPGERLYRSGDLAKYLPAGGLGYLGRIDHQVKIRGYRIEIGEIESQLLGHEAIREVCVVAREMEGGEHQLCAYYTAPEKLMVHDLRTYLSEVLPDYMLPAYFVHLSAMPLTVNGKVDRKQLPDPTGKVDTGIPYVAPSTTTETALEELWKALLRVERIGIDDNFFELGGHSLNATLLVQRIHQRFEAEVPLGTVFQTPTIRQLAQYIEQAGEQQFEQIPIAPVQDYYPLTAAQRRMYLLDQFEAVGTTYNMPIILSVEGALDRAKVETALKALIQRHESLRTSFHFVDGEPVQQVHQQVDLALVSQEANESEVPGLIAAFIQPFDLAEAPLLRAKVLTLSPDRSVLMVDMHHIISDGLSMQVLMEDFMALYQGQELGVLPLQFKDYAVWQARQGTVQAEATYWQTQLAGELPVLNLPTDFKRPPIQSFEGGHAGKQLPSKLVEQLKALAAETGATLFMVMQAAFAVLLSRLSFQEDICMGTPVAGRPHAQLQSIIGIFINTIVLRNQVKGAQTFKAFLEEVKANTLAALSHQTYPFEDLVEALELKRDLSRNPIFDVMFTFQKEEQGTTALEGLRFQPFPATHAISKFDLTLAVVEAGGQIHLNVEYCSQLFLPETLDRWLSYYMNILEAVGKDPGIAVGKIDFLSKEEVHQLLHTFNATQQAFPIDVTVHQQIEKAATQYPNHTAVASVLRQLTYTAFNEKANQLARLLRDKGVGKDVVVGVLSEATVEMMVGILAVLKAGGAYLPIDPAYPQDRIEYMLQDSRALLLLTQQTLVEKFSNNTIPWINLDDATIYNGEASNLDPVSGYHDLAYVIYTSGSSGQPKGVAVEHRALLNLCHWHNRYYAVRDSDKATKYAGLGFDASVWEIFPYWLAGAALVIVPDEVRLDVGRLHQFYVDQGVTISFLPTQMGEVYLQEDFKGLQKLLVGGDKLSAFQPRDYAVYNNYGPTENAVVATSCLVEAQTDNIPIGKPVDNTRIYLMSKDMALQPIGAPGELCISGDSLARGYLYHPELTEKHFVENPFEAGQRLYKTGDLARWQPDGNIAFLGRIDQQVKIRGYRVELGEIEQQLLAHDSVKEAVVLDQTDTDGQKYLVGFFVASEELGVEDVRAFLSQTLPGYMVPGVLVQLDTIPLTPNGKADLRQLRAMDQGKAVASSVPFVAPNTTTQQQLAKIWSEVLGVEKIGIDDNFFELGGNSLKVVKLLKLLESAFPGRLKISQLFDKPTIRLVAVLLNEAEQAAQEDKPKRSRRVEF